MKWNLLLFLAVLVLSGCTNATPAATPTPTPVAPDYETVALPEVRLTGNVSLEETLLNRRSIRQYTGEALTLEEVSQLLWSAQGITAEWGGRTAPSAGALYPLEIYLAAGNVESLAPGVYKYRPDELELVIVSDEDVREELAEAALSQAPVRDGAIDIIISAVYERTMRKYGDRGVRYVHMEAGHAAQNIYLQATALDLGTVTIGAFADELVKDVLSMPEVEAPLYIIPVGRRV
jgi:SagB-type dehydrogenase family enzyme